MNKIFKYLFGKKEVKPSGESIEFIKQIKRVEIKRAIKDFREYLNLLVVTEDGEIENGVVYLNDLQAAVVENKIEEMRAKIKKLFQARNVLGF